MSRLRFNWQQAVAHLRSQCELLGAFIDAFGSRRLQVSKDGDPFPALARAIAYQQLSGKAASTIHGRFEQLFPGGQPDAVTTLELSFEQLRAVGLSRAKALSISDLAEKTVAGVLPGRRRLGRMADEEILEVLCQVRGIGPWTAQMYLMFNMGRPDVMPATDLGVQKGVQNVYRLASLPSPAEVLDRTRHLAPYRSAASWYFWRATEDGWFNVDAGPEA